MERRHLQCPTSRLRYHSHNIYIELDYTFSEGAILPPRQQKLVWSKGKKHSFYTESMYIHSVQEQIQSLSMVLKFHGGTIRKKMSERLGIGGMG